MVSSAEEQTCEDQASDGGRFQTNRTTLPLSLLQSDFFAVKMYFTHGWRRGAVVPWRRGAVLSALSSRYYVKAAAAGHAGGPENVSLWKGG